MDPSLLNEGPIGRGDCRRTPLPNSFHRLLTIPWNALGFNALGFKIGPATRRAAAGRMRDLFEAGLNEAAASLAAILWAFNALGFKIGPATRRAAAGRMRDLFEAGLNEAAASLAAILWAFVGCGDRARGFDRAGSGPTGLPRQDLERGSRKVWGLDRDFSGVSWATFLSTSDKAQVCWHAALHRAHGDVGRRQKPGPRVRRHDVSQ